MQQPGHKLRAPTPFFEEENMQAIKLTQLVMSARMGATDYPRRQIGIPVSRIDTAKEQEINSEITPGHKLPVTEITKVNGDVLYVTEPLDEVLARINAEAN